jgi:hypothetical protein
MARHAFAANTLRAWRADWEVFGEFCLAFRVDALPADLKTVRDFVFECLSKGKKPATIRRYVSKKRIGVTAHRGHCGGGGWVGKHTHQKVEDGYDGGGGNGVFVAVDDPASARVDSGGRAEVRSGVCEGGGFVNRWRSAHGTECAGGVEEASRSRTFGSPSPGEGRDLRKRGAHINLTECGPQKIL